MRFDLERALALAQSFETERTPGSAAEQRAAHCVEELFSEAGLSVDRLDFEVLGEASPPSTTLGAGAILAGVLLALTSWAAGLVLGPDPLTLAIGFGGLMLLGLLERRLREGCWGRPRVRSSIIQGVRPAPTEGRPRVIFATSLASRLARRSVLLRRLVGLGEAVWLAVLIGPCFLYGGWYWLGQAGPALLIGLGALSLAANRTRRPAPRDADNRSGLALLVELARAWSPTASSRLEVRFVAYGSLPDGPAFARLLGIDSNRPTLVIHLDAPGVGKELILTGPQSDQALAMARDLWLPARAWGWDLGSAGGLVGWPGWSTFRITTSNDHAFLDPACLAAAGQLGIEAALRWGRAHTEKTDP